MNEMRKLMEAVEQLNESTDYDGVKVLANDLGEAIGGKIVLDEQMKDSTDSHYTDEQLVSVTDNYVTHITKQVREAAQKRIMQHTRGGPKGEAIEEADIEEGHGRFFGKKERDIGEIGAELADRSVVRQASNYAVEFAQNPSNYDLYSDEDKQKIWNDIKTVVLKVWEDQQRG